MTFTVDRLRISATGEEAKGAVLDVSVLLEDGRDGTYTLENRIDGKLVETSSVSGNSIPSAGKISLRQGAASVYRISGVPYGKHEVTVSVSNGKTTAESRFTYTLDQTLLLSGTVTVGEKKTAFTLTLEDGDTGTAYGLITNLDGKETNALRGEGYDPAAKKVTFPSGGNGSHEMEFVLTGTDAKTSCKVPFTVETIAVRVSAEVLSTGDVEFTFTLESGDTKKQYSLDASIVNEYFGSSYELEGSTYSVSTGKLSFDRSGKAVVRAVSVDPGHCDASFTLTGETGASAKASVAFEGLVPEFAVSCEYEDYGGVIETVTLVKGDRRKVYSMYVEYARVWSNFKFSGTTYEHRAMRYISSSSNTTRSFTFGLCSTEKRSEYNPDKKDILWTTKLSVATGIDGRYKATSELKVDRKGYLRFYVHYTQGYQKTLFHYNIMLKDSAHDYTGNYAIIYRGSDDRTGVNLRAVSGISGHTDHYRWAFDDREAVFELGPFKDGVTYLFNNVFSIDRYGSGDAYGLTGGCYKYNTATGLQAISESDYQNEKY